MCALPHLTEEHADLVNTLKVNGLEGVRVTRKERMGRRGEGESTRGKRTQKLSAEEVKGYQLTFYVMSSSQDTCFVEFVVIILIKTNT